MAEMEGCRVGTDQSNGQHLRAPLVAPDPVEFDQAAHSSVVSYMHEIEHVPYSSVMVSPLPEARLSLLLRVHARQQHEVVSPSSARRESRTVEIGKGSTNRRLFHVAWSVHDL